MKKKNILIISLCFILLIMVIGYSAFSSKLNINSSSSITSNWDVEITSIEKTNTSGNIVEKNKSFTKDTATFNVELEKPGDYVYYKIGVTNKGSVAAIATLGNLTCSNNDIFECGAGSSESISLIIKENSNLTDHRLIISSNETEYFYVYIKFKSEITEMPNSLKNTLTLKLTYEQSDVGKSIKTENNCYTGKILKDGTLSITSYDITCGTEIVIPEEIAGYKVTKIADGKWDSNLGFISIFYNKGITKVTIPSTVTYIGDNAFTSNDITYLSLEENITHIGTEAFSGNQISELILPNNITYIGISAFRENNLTKIDIPSTVTYLGGGAFAKNNFPIENAFIYGRNSDGTINYDILNSCTVKNASGLTLPSVKKIITNACRGVYFQEIILPNTVESIGQLSFAGSYAQSVTLNNNLKVIGTQSFESSSFENVVIPNSVEVIESRAFGSGKLKTVTIGTGVKTIGESAFRYNKNLTEININQKEGSITGSPWGANAAINWAN